MNGRTESGIFDNDVLSRRKGVNPPPYKDRIRLESKYFVKFEKKENLTIAEMTEKAIGENRAEDVSSIEMEDESSSFSENTKDEYSMEE